MTYDPFVLAIVRDNPYLYGQALHIEPRTAEATHVRESQGVMNRVQMQLTTKATHQLESEDRCP